MLSFVLGRVLEEIIKYTMNPINQPKNKPKEQDYKPFSISAVSLGFMLLEIS